MRKRKPFCVDPKPRLKTSVDAVRVGKLKIPLSSAVRNIGLIVDAGVTMQDHTSNTVRDRFHHLRSLASSAPSCLLSSKCYCCFYGVVPT